MDQGDICQLSESLFLFEQNTNSRRETFSRKILNERECPVGTGRRVILTIHRREKPELLRKMREDTGEKEQNLFIVWVKLLKAAKILKYLFYFSSTDEIEYRYICISCGFLSQGAWFKNR